MNRDLKIYANNLEQTAMDQINTLMEQPSFQDSKVRIMPDAHAGAGCVIGFTADMGGKVVPNLIGVDIGCGMLTCELEAGTITDLKALDMVIKEKVPSGMNVHTSPVIEYNAVSTILEYGLVCWDTIKNKDWIERSVGTLGGGNHFIELDVSEDGTQYLVIHTGSRNLGKQVALHYQDIAISNCRGKKKKQESMDGVIRSLKEAGREREIESAIKNFRLSCDDIPPKELCSLTGKEKDSYINDMKICQFYATASRYSILNNILKTIGVKERSSFETIHNYIGPDNIIRKGAVSANAGEKILIPLNMRDGSLICIGKGNPDWNNSAPHGAGRTMSRTQAVKSLNLSEFTKSMDGIYTTTACQGTIDESPMAYKPAQEIIDAISPTADIADHIKPLYNFKATE